MKGKLFKGTPFAYQKSTIEDKARIQDLMVRKDSFVLKNIVCAC